MTNDNLLYGIYDMTHNCFLKKFDTIDDFLTKDYYTEDRYNIRESLQIHMIERFELIQ